MGTKNGDGVQKLLVWVPILVIAISALGFFYRAGEQLNDAARESRLSREVVEENTRLLNRNCNAILLLDADIRTLNLLHIEQEQKDGIPENLIEKVLERHEAVKCGS